MTDAPSARMLIAQAYARQFGTQVERVPHDRRHPAGKRFYRINTRGFVIEVHAPTYIVVAQVVCRSKAEADESINILLGQRVDRRQRTG
ncbi:hypothetical protein CcrColossus_gp260 [Caulobacter phage CcrColossus]|uniref:Uncharacterized protein n=1 Tax=Caulobacter phage CcrColossus TaxID=1211640 RepID=K4JUU9_9CAUD|nr:hypothetical protein CcrColossus_gp260 [Caulobacter phage CcrColossus]AFU88130.1 hypothetical protein CcrColossus_gp260 [Caulobacter phage CcrColossus]